ncbi:hypothetical protein AB9P05_24615 [Roseivirga sp. BDSF3-8]|uniref:hypothetical protein n=1 Tax=Roseivirga sp. BDSF3-8 TaxID=3241598 RepID=UPI00353219B9
MNGEVFIGFGSIYLINYLKLPVPTAYCHHTSKVPMKKPVLSFILVILFNFTLKAQQPIDLAESTVKVGGLTNEEVYFGFAAGDQIIFNFSEERGKEVKEVEIMELPATSKFMDYKTVKIENKTLTVPRTGIYKFRFKNSAIGGRVCSYKIQRIPANDSTANFNSNVYWKTLYDTTYITLPEAYREEEYAARNIVPVSKFYINSGSNATFLDGKSRIVVPVTLPPNTVEWYYEFTASRNEADVNQVTSNFKLASDLSKILDSSGFLGLGINLLTQPPGGDVCDIYLLDSENAGLFRSKVAFRYLTVGTRENLASGIVKVSSPLNQPLYLGIKNPDDMVGIHVAIEVVAITHEVKEGYRNVEKMLITENKEPYLEGQASALEVQD